MSERKLASIQQILDIQPIPDADMIEVATVNSWKLVVKKGEFKIGDKAIYCEIDSFLPIQEQYEFLRKSSYKKMGDQEGFRLRTVRMRGQLSQGLLMPLSVLPKEFDGVVIGKDVTDILGIVKYDPPLPAELEGVARGYFPSFIPKTVEDRIQNLTQDYESGFKDHVFYISEKLNGESVTFYLDDDYFGVCSRGVDLLETTDSVLWKVARQLGIENKLKQIGTDVAIQGELIGEGIKGNPYKIKGQTVRFFSAYDILNANYYRYQDFVHLIKSLDLDTVPIIEEEYRLPATIDELLLMADGISKLNTQAAREGIVVRSHDRTISFKAISNNFLLKEK